MRRSLTALAILVAPILAQEPKEPEIPEEAIDGDPFHDGRIFRGERDTPAMSVRLREGGVLQIKVGEEWKEATLDELGTFLSEGRERYEVEQGKIGKSGLEEVSLGRKATRLFLSLEADPGVPWQHLQWIFTIAMEQRFRKLEMFEGKRKLLVFLPVDCAICGFDEDYRPPPEVKAEVHLVARAEQRAKWGDLDVLRPTEVRCKCGDMETSDLAEVTDYLRKTKKKAEAMKDEKVVFYGEIKAGQKVPYAKVFDVMEPFVAAEIAGVELFGMAIPPKAVRGAKRLPFPLKNYAIAD